MYEKFKQIILTAVIVTAATLLVKALVVGLKPHAIFVIVVLAVIAIITRPNRSTIDSRIPPQERRG